MDTDRLKYFSTIAETGSLTKASQILGISHSGLSKAISALQVETGLTLFRPQGRGLEITSEGKWFYQKTQEILRIANEIAKGQRKEQRALRIGLSEVVAITCAGHLSSEFDEPLTLVEADVGEIEAKIMNDEIDFGLAFVPAPKPELEYMEIGEIHFNSYARADLLDAKSIDELPYAVPISELPQNPLGYKNRDGWPRDILRLSYFSVSGFAIALDLLRSGCAAVYMPDFVVHLENARSFNTHRIVAIKQHRSAESSRKIFLVKRQMSEESKDMKKAAKAVRRICCLKR